MNRNACLAFVLSLFVCATAFAEPQDIDKELSDLANKLAAPVKEGGKKKVTVLDFTDLQGATQGELGRYIAEQLTVNLVMNKRDFAVLDRANLKSILAEHKLTAQGLVDPANAKKLGQFAGVDALIVGTIIQKGSNVNLTAKIISTDTAEIVGAARAEFKSDEAVQQLQARASIANEGAGAIESKKAIASKEFGNVRVNVEGLHWVNGRDLRLEVEFQNKSAKESVAVALLHDPCYGPPCNVRSTLTAADGTVFYCSSSDLVGIKSIDPNPQHLTEVPPNDSIKASVAFRPNRQLGANITSYRLQSEIVLNQTFKASDYANYRPSNELPPRCKVHNLVLDLPAPNN